jgi:gliding motility-associated lipoprotein GldH
MNSISSPLLRLSAAVLLVVWFCGCDGHFAKTEKDLETECWSSSDTLRLSFQNDDTNQVYQLYFPIAITEDYPYRDLYLRAGVKAPSGEENILPSRFDLATLEGEWLSEPSGDEIPFRLNLSDGLRFNQSGEYTISLYHYMRDAEICGVREIGIVVDPAGG